MNDTPQDNCDDIKDAITSVAKSLTNSVNTDRYVGYDMCEAGNREAALTSLVLLCRLLDANGWNPSGHCNERIMTELAQHCTPACEHPNDKWIHASSEDDEDEDFECGWEVCQDTAEHTHVYPADPGVTLQLPHFVLYFNSYYWKAVPGSSIKMQQGPTDETP